MAVTITTKAPASAGSRSGVWSDAVLTAIYSLSPLHYGIGQAAAAVDLPIAREAGSQFPLLPATGLKGVARDFLSPKAPGGGDTLAEKELTRLFGPSLDQGESDLAAGALTFSEGRLVAYPVRSLNRPFFHVTCPLILERLARDLRAVGLRTDLLPQNWQPRLAQGQALVASAEWLGSPLVLEDLCYLAGETSLSQELATFGQKLAQLLPAEETDTRNRLQQGLILIADADFNEIMGRVVPVRARIKLNSAKTTGDGPGGDSGNLWYEEHLPPDCLFLALVGERRQRRRGSDGHDDDAQNAQAPLQVLRQVSQALRVVQIGGNETVGYGLCWWSGWDAAEASTQGASA